MLGQADSITKYHRLGDFYNKHLFLTVLETRDPRSSCKQGWCLVSTHSVSAQGLTMVHTSGDGEGGGGKGQRGSAQCLL